VGDCSAAAPTPSTDVLHAGAECGLTTIGGRTGGPLPPGPLLRFVGAGGG